MHCQLCCVSLARAVTRAGRNADSHQGIVIVEQPVEPVSWLRWLTVGPIDEISGEVRPPRRLRLRREAGRWDSGV